MAFVLETQFFMKLKFGVAEVSANHHPGPEKNIPDMEEIHHVSQWRK